MLSTEMIAEVLRGRQYPARKGDILLHATTHGAPARLLRVLDALPDRTYTSGDDVWEAIMQVLMPTA